MLPGTIGGPGKIPSKAVAEAFLWFDHAANWSTIFNNKRPELLEMYLYNGTFGIRLDARDILKR